MRKDLREALLPVAEAIVVVSAIGSTIIVGALVFYTFF